MSRAASSSSDILLYILAIFLPFVPVYIKTGCSNQLLLNIILCIFAWLPGIVHAWWIIGRNTTPAGGVYTTSGAGYGTTRY